MSKSLTERDFDQVESWIGTGPKTFNLLYSITRDGCNASVFHQKCDNQGPTLTILYNKEGSVFGGYNGVSWVSPLKQLNQTDEAAFLYQLYFSGNKIQRKCSLKRWQTSSCSISGYGPVFGSALYTDLNTFKSNIQKSTSGEYNLNGNMDSYGKNYESQGTSSKEVNNGHMRVTELEVYAVKDGQRKLPDLPTQWRKTAEWGPKLLDSLKEEIKGIKPPKGHDVPHFNILLIGHLGSGKSSFCNLVTSVFRGRISHRARVGGTSQTSTTTLFTPYDFGEKAGLRLYDSRGIAETDRLDLLQCNFILDGNVPDFYEMTPTSLISNDDANFRQRPTLRNKIHCVVFVLDGSTVDDISTPMLQKLESYRDLLNRKEIPQAVLVTNIDKLCKHISKTFESLTVKEVVDKVAVLLKLPRNSILPVKNYEEEMESDENINILALLAVRQIMFFAEDYLENRKIKQIIRSRGEVNSDNGQGEVFGSDTA
ncbi:interferon-induced protein 44-like isoform X1 [Mya arenaria]|uniref:interferon-induced protein 44-like isoform X1 n=1 Tax=Mya arenaria TaxID=6604 RepID=UPI0022E08811|nr:interferon-induced protein 44-like isoform X1 [Mya arenaria]